MYNVSMYSVCLDTSKSQFASIWPYKGSLFHGIGSWKCKCNALHYYTIYVLYSVVGGGPYCFKVFDLSLVTINDLANKRDVKLSTNIYLHGFVDDLLKM
jgi:hypothetical protein